MSDINEALARAKSCFGCFEDWSASWHCKACPIRDECKIRTEEKRKENE